MTTPVSRGTLLAIIELGAYPNFTPLYEQAGYSVTIERSMRKALPQVRKLKPTVVVAEFNFQSDFRDRTSSLESLLAVVQTFPGTKVIVFFEAEQAHQFERLRARFPIHAALTYPIDPAQLTTALTRA
jgi:AmiR/NasT family two-component response regulator